MGLAAAVSRLMDERLGPTGNVLLVEAAKVKLDAIAEGVGDEAAIAALRPEFVDLDANIAAGPWSALPFQSSFQ